MHFREIVLEDVICGAVRDRSKSEKNIFWFSFIKPLSLAPVWPDLTKFRHFGKKIKVFGHVLKFNSVLYKKFHLLGQFFNAIYKFIVNG